MRYTIVKFESDYGPAIYRVRLHRFIWVSWLKADGGHVLNFETKAQAHAHMCALFERRSDSKSPPLRMDGARANRFVEDSYREGAKLGF